MSHYSRKQRNRKEELALVDHPSGLLPWELRFCQEYAVHGQLIDAMREVIAAEDFREEDYALRLRAVKLLKKPLVKKYLQHLQKRLEDIGVASMVEVQTFLSDAIRTPIDQIDASSPLCQKRIIRTTTSKDGSQAETETLESISKMDAANTLIKMKGWDAPIKVDVNHSGGVMLIPMADNLTDWEKAAADSQAKLMKDAIDI